MPFYLVGGGGILGNSTLVKQIILFWAFQNSYILAKWTTFYWRLYSIFISCCHIAEILAQNMLKRLSAARNPVKIYNSIHFSIQIPQR